ncbi:hypothetical protein HHI36_005947 [Cryptolaemus montrouzieri]|uniref:Uncharacterized protein n=1 Tax=Cryptolaemus montrouzieri TaxID=559131 RepID=A0ABD2NVV3_9CUCU
MGKFWDTIDLLVEKDWKRTDVIVRDWMEDVITNRNMKVIEEERKGSVENVFGMDRSTTITFEHLDSKIEDFLRNLKVPKLICTYVNFVFYYSFMGGSFNILILRLLSLPTR